MGQTGKKLSLLNYFCPVSLSFCFLFWKDACHINVFHLCSFLDDIEVMLKWRPPAVYKYLWKYVCLFAMIGLLAASLLRMVFKRPTYTAWNQTTVRYRTKAFCPTSNPNLKILCYSLQYMWHTHQDLYIVLPNALNNYNDNNFKLLKHMFLYDQLNIYLLYFQCVLMLWLFNSFHL